MANKLPYDPLEYALDRLYDARALWEKHEWGHGTHNVGRIAIDEALDHYNELREDIDNFERVFGAELPRLPERTT